MRDAGLRPVVGVSATEETLERVSRTVGPVTGAIALMLASRRGPSRRSVLGWVEKLRAAADDLEKLL